MAQSFVNDLKLAADYISTQLASLPEKKAQGIDHQIRSVDTLTLNSIQGYETTVSVSLRELGRAYNNDLTDQAEVDLKSVYKLVLAFISESALQPIVLASNYDDDKQYIVSGRHRLLAFAYIGCVANPENFLEQEIDVSEVTYKKGVHLDQVIIGANDSRRVRPTERTQMKLSQAGLSTIDELSAKPGKVLLKGLVSREVMHSYDGELRPVTVQKISDKFVQLLYSHPVFQLSRKPETHELSALSRYCSELGYWLAHQTPTLYRDYGNVALSVSDIGTKYQGVIKQLLDEVLEVVQLDDNNDSDDADDGDVVIEVESAPSPVETIDFDVIEL